MADNVGMLTRPLETAFWIGALAARGRVVDLEVDRDMEQPPHLAYATSRIRR